MLTHLEESTNVTSRGFWCKNVVRQIVAYLAKEVNKSMCQGIENGLKTSLIERNSQVSHVQWCNKKSWDELMRRPNQLISLRRFNNNRNNSNVRWSRSSLMLYHSHPVRAMKIRCKSNQRFVVPESQKMRRTREQCGHVWTWVHWSATCVSVTSRDRLGETRREQKLCVRHLHEVETGRGTGEWWAWARSQNACWSLMCPTSSVTTWPMERESGTAAAWTHRRKWVW